MKETTMATKKKTATQGGAAARLRQTWSATVSALTSAEQEVEKQVRLLLKKNKIDTKDAQAMLKTLGARVQSERKRAARELESRLKTLQSRIKKERKALGRTVDDAVQGALATFNIPSRQEVADLTRKVEELSRKIDGLKRRPSRPVARPAPASAQ
jgi:polyhydroxyalkanoate synthesis regulator phasin